ncbi:MAG TPA: class I SAM-dependent RNA methyltransferase [Syntrophomonadaceae bacterium]|nr:class I SAM-dependent RNA methyltransferase [Syntrophomonadaceae bacterium]
MNNIELIATSAFGLESVLAVELKKLGYADLTVENGKVTFAGDGNAIARCNIWLRTADRLFIKVGQFPATTFEELFEKTKALPWEDLIPEDAEFPVEGKSIKSKLFSVSDCQAIVKKAVVEKMKMKYKRSWFPEKGPRFKIQIALLNNMATLSIDTSGAGLHKRGYRQKTGDAPLKETLAAAMILLSRWKPDRVFIDPFCGSGTIPIEAAMIGRNIAPGLHRDFASQHWPDLNKHFWINARQEAADLADHDQPLGIFGFDIDQSAVELARYHAAQAGFKNLLSFQRQDITELKSRYKYGYLIANPPYGERLSEKKSVIELYKTMRQIFHNLDTWSFYILTSHQNFENLLGRKADKKRKLYNGRILVNYYQYFGPKPTVLEGPFTKKNP